MPVASGRLELLRWQYRMVSGLAFDVHLPALTDELCAWSPEIGLLRHQFAAWVGPEAA